MTYMIYILAGICFLLLAIVLHQAFVIWNLKGMSFFQWHLAVSDQCIIYHTTYFEDDPGLTLHNLLCVVQSIAKNQTLDPKVCSDARDLINRGRQDSINCLQAIHNKSTDDDIKDFTLKLITALKTHFASLDT